MNKIREIIKNNLKIIDNNLTSALNYNNDIQNIHSKSMFDKKGFIGRRKRIFKHEQLYLLLAENRLQAILAMCQVLPTTQMPFDYQEYIAMSSGLQHSYFYSKDFSSKEQMLKMYLRTIHYTLHEYNIKG